MGWDDHRQTGLQGQERGSRGSVAPLQPGVVGGGQRQAGRRPLSAGFAHGFLSPVPGAWADTSRSRCCISPGETGRDCRRRLAASRLRLQQSRAALTGGARPCAAGGAPAGRPAPHCGARWSPRRRGEGGGARARACCATRGAGNPGADKPDARWGETRARPRPGPWRPPPELVRGTRGGGCVAECAPPRSWCPSHTCVRVSNPACKMLSFYFT